MLMETLQCNYPAVPSGLPTGGPLSPPPTPPSDKFMIDSSSECSPTLYSETRYSSEERYSSSPLLHRRGHEISSISSYEEDDDTLNNNNNVPDSYESSYDKSLTGLSKLRIADANAPPTDLTDNTSSVYHKSAKSSSKNSGSSSPKRKKSSKSKTGDVTPTPNENEKSRKDSFVYDVRMTNEQFLFFVPDLDLVKSHLMFAVREEVEVLKERIVELMERINILEVENNVLRTYATPEALIQLQQAQQQHQQQQNQHPSS